MKEIYEITYQFIERVEDTIKSGVKKILSGDDDYDYPVRDTIQNGVKNTENFKHERIYSVDDTIQNGVKQTSFVAYGLGTTVEDIIQNGVKDTKEMNHDRHSYHGYFKLENDIPTHIPMVQVQDVVQDGVKHCEDGDRLDGDERFEDIIQNGVRESIEEYHHRRREVVLVTNNNKLS